MPYHFELDGGGVHEKIMNKMRTGRTLINRDSIFIDLVPGILFIYQVLTPFFFEGSQLILPCQPDFLLSHTTYDLLS